jgi:alginate O-acetyltransferase complex protein AlgJ
MPSKETIYPERLVAGYPLSSGPPANVGTAHLVSELVRRGVRVFDPKDVLWRNKARHATPLYLPRDTHWTPTGMDLVAREVARIAREAGYASGARRVTYRLAALTVENRGDLYDMLDLPTRRMCFAPSRIRAVRVLMDGTGEPFRPDPQAPILLLGDSYTNVFSDGELGWGQTAGFAEHLALHLGTGLDVIALNDGGVNGSRQRLARMPARLLGKRLVIWQFATRDFTIKAGQWKCIPLRTPRAST